MAGAFPALTDQRAPAGPYFTARCSTGGGRWASRWGAIYGSSSSEPGARVHAAKRQHRRRGAARRRAPRSKTAERCDSSLRPPGAGAAPSLRRFEDFRSLRLRALLRHAEGGPTLRREARPPSPGGRSGAMPSPLRALGGDTHLRYADPASVVGLVGYDT